MFGFLKRKSDVTDETAMKRFIRGDTDSFELLLSRYNQRIFSFILRMVYGNRSVAEDLFQEIFIKVIENRESYDSPRTFRSWLYGIARNHVIDHLRSEKLRRHDSLDEYAHVDNPNITRLDQVKSTVRSQDELVHDRNTRDRIYETLDKIKDEHREIFILREIEGMKFDEIAGITETNINTVKSRHRYAFKELREKLMETGYFDGLKDVGEG